MKKVHWIAGDVMRGSGNDTACNTFIPDDEYDERTALLIEQVTCARCLKIAGR